VDVVCKPKVDEAEEVEPLTDTGLNRVLEEPVPEPLCEADDDFWYL
jgi:hypothetical protein